MPLTWLGPVALALGFGCVLALTQAAAASARGDRPATVRWGQRAAGAGLALSACLATGWWIRSDGWAPPAWRPPLPPGAVLPGGPAVPAGECGGAAVAAPGGGGATLPLQDTAPLAEARTYLQSHFRPLLAELGPLLDRYLATPQPPPDAGARMDELVADRVRLQQLQAQLLAVPAPALARPLAQQTEVVMNGLLRVVEQELGAVSAGRWPAAELSDRRQLLRERYVDPWLDQLLHLVGRTGAAG